MNKIAGFLAHGCMQQLNHSLGVSYRSVKQAVWSAYLVWQMLLLLHLVQEQSQSLRGDPLRLDILGMNILGGLLVAGKVRLPGRMIRDLNTMGRCINHHL